MNGEFFGCDNHSVSERVLMAALKAVMEKIQILSSILKSNMTLEILSIRKNSGEESIIAKQDEIAKLKKKKLRAVDLMIDRLIDKDSLKEQTAFYDSEIERLSNEISNHNNADTIYNEQIEAPHQKAISQPKAKNRTRTRNAGTNEVRTLYNI